MRHRHLLGALCAVQALGCGPGPRERDGPDADACLDEELTIALWHGDDPERPLEDGDATTMVHGMQGGWHLGVRVEVSGSTGVAQIHGAAELEDGTAVAGGQVPQNLALEDYQPARCAGEVSDFRVYLAPGPVAICQVDGVRMWVTVDLVDLESGQETGASVEVVAELDPTDVQTCG